MKVFSNLNKEEKEEFSFKNESFIFTNSETISSNSNNNDILAKLEMFSEMTGDRIIFDYIKEDNFEDEGPTQLTNSSN